MQVLAITALAVGGVLLMMAMVALFAVYRGWVFAILWGWFAVPLFGLPALSIPAAIGIAMVVSMLTMRSSDPAKENQWATFTAQALAPLFALLIGWIAKQYM